MNSSGDDDVGGAIPVGCFQCEHHLPGTVEGKPFVGNGARCFMWAALVARVGVFMAFGIGPALESQHA
jgi:hypothetical protein